MKEWIVHLCIGEVWILCAFSRSDFTGKYPSIWGQGVVRMATEKVSENTASWNCDALMRTRCLKNRYFGKHCKSIRKFLLLKTWWANKDTAPQEWWLRRIRWKYQKYQNILLASVMRKQGHDAARIVTLATHSHNHISQSRVSARQAHRRTFHLSMISTVQKRNISRANFFFIE